MEEINVGDIVRLKGDQYGKTKFMALPSSSYTYGASAEVQKHNLIFFNELNNTPESASSVPDACLTKRSLTKIAYKKDESRTPESILIGDVVSLKINPDIKMVVYDTSSNGKDISAMYYNPLKGDICRVTSTPRECFDIYEILVRE